jgi:hypothetical protein
MEILASARVRLSLMVRDLVNARMLLKSHPATTRSANVKASSRLTLLTIPVPSAYVKMSLRQLLDISASVLTRLRMTLSGSCKCKDSKKEVSGTTCKCKKFFTDVYGTCECRGDLVEPDGEDECKCKYGVGKRTHVCLDKCIPISFATEECYCDPAKNNQFYFWGKRFCLPKCKYNEVRYADLSSDKHGGDRSYTCTWCRNDGHSYYSQKDMKCYCDANGGYRSVGGMCVKDSDYTETYPTSPASSLTMTTMRVASPSTSRHTDSSVGCASGFRQCTVSQPEGPTTYCYNPQVHACVKLSSGASLICPANANAACGNGCYDPTLFACQSGGLVAL